jgi:predicted nuclease with TOPRIM domain
MKFSQISENTVETATKVANCIGSSTLSAKDKTVNFILKAKETVSKEIQERREAHKELQELDNNCISIAERLKKVNDKSDLLELAKSLEQQAKALKTLAKSL